MHRSLYTAVLFRGYMKYRKIVKGGFIERPNRFIAKVKIEDETYIIVKEDDILAIVE